MDHERFLHFIGQSDLRLEGRLLAALLLFYTPLDAEIVQAAFPYRHYPRVQRQLFVIRWIELLATTRETLGVLRGAELLGIVEGPVGMHRVQAYCGIYAFGKGVRRRHRAAGGILLRADVDHADALVQGALDDLAPVVLERREVRVGVGVKIFHTMLYGERASLACGARGSPLGSC